MRDRIAKLEWQRRRQNRVYNDAYKSMEQALTFLLKLFPDPQDLSEGRKLVNHLLFRWFPGW